MLSVNSVQLKCIFDAQRRKAALPGRGLEYVDSQGVKHPAVAFTFTAADGVKMPLEVRTRFTGSLSWLQVGQRSCLMAVELFSHTWKCRRP